MSNLTLAKQFDDVYQLETTDKPLGGSAGIANRQALQLGNRTEWLKDRAGSFAGYQLIASGSATTTLTAADKGKVFFLGSNLSVNLPACNTLTPGDRFCFFSNQNNVFTIPAVINATGANVIRVYTNYFPASIIVYPGELFELWTDGATWHIGKGAETYEAVGMVRDWPLSGLLPDGYLEANGAAISRTTYSRLWTRVNTVYGGSVPAVGALRYGTYNAGNGTTTFGLPDRRGLYLQGYDADGVREAGRTVGDYRAHQILYTAGASAFDTQNTNTRFIVKY